MDGVARIVAAIPRVIDVFVLEPFTEAAYVVAGNFTE
jgi:hypothetical protein